MEDFIKRNYRWIIGAVLAAVAIVSILNAKNDSLIYDEDAHIPAGYSYLTQHDMRLNPEHPPLIKDLAALPLLSMHLNFDTSLPFWNKDPDTAQWEAGKVLLFESGNNPDKIIFWSRIPIILLSLLLGLFIFKWTRELAGTAAGVFAFLLYAFDPNVLGHNHFVTTDLGIAAFVAFSFYYYFRFIKDPSWKNVFWAGLFLGLVQLAKFSSVLIFPVFFLATIIYPLVRLNRHHLESDFRFRIKRLFEYIGKAIIVLIFSLVIVWVIYYLDTYRMPQAKLPEIINYYFNTATLPVIYAKKIFFWLNNFAFLAPLADYFFGVSRVIQRVSGGNSTYFLGELSTNKGFLSYFPIVFLIKESFSALILFLAALVIAFFRLLKTTFQKEHGFSHKIRHYLRKNITEFSMFLFIVLYAVTSIYGRLNIGFRHLFPILPLAFILCAKILFHFVRRVRSPQTRFIFYASLLFLVLYLLLETVFAYPSYTSYFNESVGGPKNGYKYVTDSNADWGQDLKRLKNFLDLHPEIGKIRVDYFGMADVAYYLGDKYELWSNKQIPLSETGWYAISTEFLEQSIHDKSKPDSQSYRWLENKKPAYQVGTSILIYYISADDLKSIQN